MSAETDRQLAKAVAESIYAMTGALPSRGRINYLLQITPTIVLVLVVALTFVLAACA